METTMTNPNVEMLNSIYQNAAMGTDALRKLWDKVGDVNMKSQLQNQINEYEGIKAACIQELTQYGEQPKENGLFANMELWSGIQINTLKDRSNSHIAEMLIEGSTMGVVEMTRKLKQNTNIKPETAEIGQKLVDIEEDNIENMKNFL